MKSKTDLSLAEKQGSFLYLTAPESSTAHKNVKSENNRGLNTAFTNRKSVCPGSVPWTKLASKAKVEGQRQERGSRHKTETKTPIHLSRGAAILTYMVQCWGVSNEAGPAGGVAGPGHDLSAALQAKSKKETETVIQAITP